MVISRLRSSRAHPQGRMVLQQGGSWDDGNRLPAQQLGVPSWAAGRTHRRGSREAAGAMVIGRLLSSRARPQGRMARQQGGSWECR
jgi:hypothetical protein